MSQERSPERIVAAPGMRSRLESPGPAFTNIKVSAAIAVVAFLAASLVMLMYSPMRHVETGDPAIHDYMAQCIARGQVPYRDAIDGKGPGSLYLSAAVMAAGKAVGLQDILAVRVFYVLLGGILCAITYLVAEAYLRSRIAGVIAFSVPLMSDQFAEMIVAGTRPKIPMIIFGLVALLFIARDRPFLTGISSMLSCLCWQPGLAFTGVALLMFSRYLTTWRDLRALKVLLGAAIPLAVVISYFYAVGALGDLLTWTFHYNYTVYLPEGQEPAGSALAQLWSIVNGAFGANSVWLMLSIVGAVVYGGSRVWTRLKNKKLVAVPELFKDALLIPPLIHFGFSIVNWPGMENLIPFFPFFGIFTGYLIVVVVRLIASIRPIAQNAHAVRLIEWSPILPLFLIWLSVINHANSDMVEPGRTLQDQQRMVQAVADLLGPDDKIYVHGTLEILVLLNRPNMNPYIFLDRGKDKYIGDRTPGGFGAIMNEMKAQAPKVIAISRTKNVAYGEELKSWATEEYDRFPLEFAHNSVFVRKPQK
jgi:DolP-mannose mannosyltransferase